MYTLLQGLTRSETWLELIEMVVAGPEATAGPALPLAAQLDFVAREINDGAARVRDGLSSVPDEIRFTANQAAEAVEDTLADIRRNLPEGITEPFVPEEADVMQLWNNLPRFGNNVAMTELDQATLQAPPRMRPRSFTENLERSMNEIDQQYRAELRASQASSEAVWNGIRERAALKVRVSDIAAVERRGGWTAVSSELEPVGPQVEMTVMGTIPEDAGALDLQRLVLADDEVERAVSGLVNEISDTYLAMQDINAHGMGMLSDGTLLTTEQPIASVENMARVDRQLILAAGKTAFLELEEVTVPLPPLEQAGALEAMYTGRTPSLMSMETWHADAAAEARSLLPAADIDEFDAALDAFEGPVLEPLEVVDTHLVDGLARAPGGFEAEQAHDFVAVAGSDHVGAEFAEAEQALGAIEDAVAVARAAALAEVRAVEGVEAVEEGAEAARVAARTVVIAEVIATATLSGLGFNVGMVGVALAIVPFINTVSSGSGGMMGHQPVTAGERREGEVLRYERLYRNHHEKWTWYNQHLARRRAMAGQHFSYMDPATGLWRVARCTHYTFPPTLWSEATEAQWQRLRDGFLTPLVPQVPLPDGVVMFAPVSWPPLRESWKFGPPLTGPWTYSHHAAGPRARGFVVTDVARIKAAPLTPGQLAWNRRVLEMQRVRLTQVVALWALRRANQALMAALRPAGPAAVDRGDLVRNAEAALVQRNNHATNQNMPGSQNAHAIGGRGAQLAPGAQLGNFGTMTPHSQAGLDEQHLNWAIRKQISEHQFTKAEIIAEWSKHYSGSDVVGLTNAAWIMRQTDPGAFDRAVARDGTTDIHGRQLGGVTGLGSSLVPGTGGLSESAVPAVHRPIVMGGMTPGQLNRELRRLVDLGSFPPGAIETEFGKTYGHANVVRLVQAAEAAQQAAGTYAFHQTIRAEQRPAALRAADAREANVPAGPGIAVIGMRPADIMDPGADTSSGRPGAGAVVPAGAINVRPADVVARTGHRHRHTEAAAIASTPWHLVPVQAATVATFNPADWDKGISSHTLATSGASSSIATSQSSAFSGDSFWHTVGSVYQAGRTVANYYMGNDPCRVASGRRRMVQTTEAQLTVLGGETFEDWFHRNSSAILASGATTMALARAMYNNAEPPRQTQADCTDSSNLGTTVHPEDVGGVKPIIGPIDLPTATFDSQGASGTCELQTVDLTGGTKVDEGRGPQPTTTDTVPKPCGKPGAGPARDYAVAAVALILLIALAAIAIS